MPEPQITELNRADPLSEVTRREKRNLLAVSLFSITLKAFSIRLTEIELEGNKISFQEEAIPFVTALSGCYFVITFITYWFIDFKNYQKTEHQQNLRRVMHDKTSGGSAAYWKRISGEICRLFTDDLVSVRENAAGPLHGRLYGQSTAEKVEKAVAAFIVSAKGDACPDAAALVKGMLPDHIRNRLVEHQFKQRLVSRWYWSHMVAYEALYFFRNIVWDFALPLAVALYAGLVILGKADPSWVRDIV